VRSASLELTGLAFFFESQRGFMESLSQTKPHRRLLERRLTHDLTKTPPPRSDGRADTQWWVRRDRYRYDGHGLSIDQDRSKFNLPGAYPMVALPDYAKTRSSLAKEMGLGKSRSVAPKEAARGK
jgi:hypothetical protein